MKIEIKNRFTGDVIFTHECENNTIKITVEEAVKSKANLSDANLSHANLSHVNLSDANLSDANLSHANLSDANLRNANLSHANLSHANLSDANLSHANLRNADLSDADLSDADLWNANLWNANLSHADLSDANLRNAKNLDKTVKLPMYCKWTHGITNGNLIHIGCEKRTIKEWDLFFESDKIISTERNTPEFKQIQAVYEAYKSYLNFLSK